jgi:cell wall-associated NlpC family hydrolase
VSGPTNSKLGPDDDGVGQAGVGMPHGSTEQCNMFPHVSLSQAVSGDLIVWDGHGHLHRAA